MLCPEPHARIGWQTALCVGEAKPFPYRSPAASWLATRAKGAHAASGTTGGGVPGRAVISPYLYRNRCLPRF